MTNAWRAAGVSLTRCRTRRAFYQPGGACASLGGSRRRSRLRPGSYTRRPRTDLHHVSADDAELAPVAGSGRGGNRSENASLVPCSPVPHRVPHCASPGIAASATEVWSCLAREAWPDDERTECPVRPSCCTHRTHKSRHLGRRRTVGRSTIACPLRPRL